METQLIVTDLDRTLLYTHKIISDYTVQVLERACASGIRFAFATARPLRAVTQFIERFATPPDAVIVHNGAGIYTRSGTGYTPHTIHGIAPSLRDATLTALAQAFPAATLSVEIGDTLYGNDNLFALWANTEAERADFTELPYPPEHPLAPVFAHPADKIIIGVHGNNDLERYLAHIPGELYLQMCSGKEQNLGLIMHKNASKWNAVQALAAHFDILEARIMAFGDDYNDVEMLANCGVGVAVANAVEAALAAADYICGSHDQDGVAKFIKENLL